jgi:hypothetical protein
MSKSLKIIRGVLVLIAIGLVFFVIIQDFVPSGQIVGVKDFKHKSYFISDFYPAVRVWRTECESNKCYQTIVGEPVYFFVSVPRAFKTAQVKIIYQNIGQPEISLGVVHLRETGAVDLKILDKHSVNEMDLINSSWQEKTIIFESLPSQNNKIEFVISAPEIDYYRGQIKISHLEVKLNKEPWHWYDFWPRFKNYLNRILS